MKVLIVEDAEFIAKGIRDALSAQGNEVDWIIGVRSFQPFLGINESKQDIPMDPSSYDVVLCDGQTFGPNEGPAIVQHLASIGITCVGISSTPDYNQAMVQNGAVMGFLKVVAFAAIVEDVLTMQSVRAPSPDLVEQVNAFEPRLRADRDLRRKLDAIIEPYMR